MENQNNSHDEGAQSPKEKDSEQDEIEIANDESQEESSKEIGTSNLPLDAMPSEDFKMPAESNDDTKIWKAALSEDFKTRMVEQENEQEDGAESNGQIQETSDTGIDTVDNSENENGHDGSLIDRNKDEPSELKRDISGLRKETQTSIAVMREEMWRELGKTINTDFARLVKMGEEIDGKLEVMNQGIEELLKSEERIWNKIKKVVTIFAAILVVREILYLILS